MSILEKSGILMSGRKNGHTDRRKLRLRGKLAIGVIIASIFLLLTLIKISTRTAFPIEKDAATRSQRSNVRSLLQLEDLVSSDTRPVIDGTTPTQKENECRDFHHLNISDVCAFINATADCLIGDGFINYVKVVYCSFSHLIPLGVITLTIWWLFLFAGLASTADEFFCPNLAVISKTLRLSQNIAGVTFLAFGNGAPDIFSSISAVGNAKDGDAGLAIGALVGAGIFVTTVVAGTISIVCPFTSMERPFLRDIVFYIGAVFWTFYVLYDGDISTAEAVGFICYYVVYVLLVVIGRAVYQYRKKATNSPKPDVPGITEDDLHGWYLMSFIKYQTFYNPLSGRNSPQIFRRSSKKHKVQVESRIDTISERVQDNDIIEDTFTIQAGAPTYGALDDDEVAILPPPIESRPQRAVKGLAKVAEFVSVTSLFGNQANTNDSLLPRDDSSVDLGKLRHSSSFRQFFYSARGSISSLSTYIKKYSNKLRFKRFLKAINPINTEDWSTMNVFWKTLEIFKCPLILALKLTIPLVDYEDTELHKWNKILACLQCFTAPLYCIFATRVALIPINGVFPVWGLVMILCSVFALVVSFTSAFDEIPKYHWVFAYAGFFVSVIWIYSIANEIVNLLQMFGVVFSISNAILGLTLLAWGNSVGDMIANTATARLGFPRMAISACFGGPLFNMLMGIGIPFTIGTIRHNGNFTLKFTLLQLVLICSLAGSLIMSLIAVPLRKFKFSAIYGGLLIAYYIVFLIIAVLVETQVITSSNAIFKQ
ncbi:mitochondrial sodium/calcium exchanger protein-like isoform X1 [Tubulanus polymorphus]|uniref:mitochondrial sodium/calcium exchanger protein-like isoform X1 n=1 Tax=Tubulanus polymorphus TaxID=672921 RepID=UPI003DA4A4E4